MVSKISEKLSGMLESVEIRIEINMNSVILGQGCLVCSR
jgi:hypothetical protein